MTREQTDRRFATPARDRLRAGIGVAIVHALLGLGLLLGLSTRTAVRARPELAVFDIREAPPPPRPRARPEKTRAHAGAAAPRGLKAKPAEVVAPPPLIPLVAPPVLIVAPRPGQGMQPSAGASDRAGPGTGSGGRGTGSGSGSDGDGDGDDSTPPRRIRGRIRNSDYPHPLSNAGIGGTVSVRYRVGEDGRASKCTVTASSGNAELDMTTCRLIEERFRFDPSRDEDGRPVASYILENHSWVIDPGEPPPNERDR